MSDLAMHILLFSRFAHSSVQLPSGEILIIGGYGCTGMSGPHMRLDDVLVMTKVAAGVWGCRKVPTAGNGPGDCDHQFSN